MYDATRLGFCLVLRALGLAVVGILMTSLVVGSLIDTAKAQDPELLVPTGHREGLSLLELSPDHQYVLSGGHGGALKVWDLSSGYLVAEQRQKVRFNGVTAVAFHPTAKRVFFATVGGSVYVWDWVRGEPTPIPIGAADDDWKNITLSLAVSPDGRRLALGDDYANVGVWDLKRERFTWQANVEGEIWPEQLNADKHIGRFFQRLAGRRAFMPFLQQIIHALQRHDVDAEEEVERILTRARKEKEGVRHKLNDRQFGYLVALRVVDLSFQEDGRRLVALGQTGDTFVFDGAGDLQTYHDLETHGLALSLSDNGRYVATSSYGKVVNVWNAVDAAHQWSRRIAPGERRIRFHEWTWFSDVRSLRVSNSGERIAACMESSAVLIERYASSRSTASFPLRRAAPAPSADCALALSGDGSRLVLASSLDRLNYTYDFRNADTEGRLRSFRTAQAAPSSFHLASDGRVLLTGTDHHPLWSLRTGRVDAVLQTESAIAGHVAFRPKDQRLYHLFNEQEGGLAQLTALPLPRPSREETWVEAAPRVVEGPSLRCSAGHLDTAHRSGLMLLGCEESSNPVRGSVLTHMMAFYPNSIRKRPLIEIPVLDTLAGAVLSAALHPYHDEAATGSTTGEVRFWNLTSGETIDSVYVFRDLGGLSHVDGRITALAYGAQSGNIVAGGHRTSISGGDFIGTSKNRLGVVYYKERRGWKRRVLGAYNRKADVTLSEEVSGHVQSLALHEDETLILVGTTSGHVFLVDVDEEEVIARLDGHSDPVVDLQFIPEKERFMSLSASGELKLWDLNQRTEIITLLTFEAAQRTSKAVDTESVSWIALTPDGYYTASKGAADLVGFRSGDQVYTFSQFDLRFNRPDIVLQHLESADQALIQAYRGAYEKRLEKMGLTHDALEGNLHIPTLQIVRRDEIPHRVEAETIDVDIRAQDTRYNLDRLHVWINDVPTYGREGLRLDASVAQDVSRTLPLRLSRGENKIEISVTNTQGSESLRRVVYVRRESPPQKPDLHLIAIGVSEYQDASWNLTYAAKDARDVARLLRTQDRYRTVHTHVLTDQEATASNVLSLRNRLEKTRVDDHVVVFAAGHGLMSDDLEYFFATHETLFDQPATRSLAYEDLEGLLDGIPARKKVLLVDACHSGEIDREEMAALSPANAEEGTVQFRSAGQIGTADQTGQLSDFQMMRELFVDLRRQTGTTVIASAGGVQAALEGDEWQNGAFTYALLSGLTTGAADGNDDGMIMVSELKQHLQIRVPNLTRGVQSPTARSENRSMDFRIW